MPDLKPISLDDLMAPVASTAGRGTRPACPSASGRATSTKSPLRSEIAALIDEYMTVDDDPILSRRGEEYLAYCHRLNADIIRLFQSLGYDSLVYTNELEDGKSAADSYVVFALTCKAA